MSKFPAQMYRGHIWDFKVEDQQGDGNSKDAIAECFHATRFHGFSLPDLLPNLIKLSVSDWVLFRSSASDALTSLKPSAVSYLSPAFPRAETKDM